MTHIKNILRNMRRELCTSVPELAFVGKDRGELAGANPAVALPCALLDVRISAFYNACDHRVAFAVSLQVSHHLTDRAAGIAFAQP